MTADRRGREWWETLKLTLDHLQAAEEDMVPQSHQEVGGRRVGRGEGVAECQASPVGL